MTDLMKIIKELKALEREALHEDTEYDYDTGRANGKEYAYGKAILKVQEIMQELEKETETASLTDYRKALRRVLGIEANSQ